MSEARVRTSQPVTPDSGLCRSSPHSFICPASGHPRSARTFSPCPLPPQRWGAVHSLPRFDFASQTTHSEPHILTSDVSTACMAVLSPATCGISSLCEMSEVAEGGEDQVGWGEPARGSLGNVAPRFEDAAVGAAGEVLPGFSFIPLPSPWGPCLALMKYFPCTPCSFLSSAGCFVHSSAENSVERAFTLENPLMFYFPPGSLPASLRKELSCVRGSLLVCEAVQGARLGLVALLFPS